MDMFKNLINKKVTNDKDVERPSLNEIEQFFKDEPKKNLGQVNKDIMTQKK